MINVASCQSCVYNKGNICKRMPPQICLVPTDNQHPVLYTPSQIQPYVDDTEWCGEYKERTYVNISR